MARTILTTPGEDVDVGGTVAVIGTRSPGEVITITRGNISLDASFNAGGDTIVLPGNSGTYTIRLSGSQAIIESGGTRVSVPLGTAGTEFQFDDNTFSLRIDAATGSALLGEQQLTSTAQPIGSGQDATALTLDADTVLGAESTLISGYDRVTLGTARDEAGEDGHVYDITLDDDNAPTSTSVLLIDGSNLAGDDDGDGPLVAENVRIDALFVRAYALEIETGDGDDVIAGTFNSDLIITNGGADLIFGFEGDDFISAGDGFDSISGGEGADTLAGGSGRDVFFYQRQSESTPENPDVIVDFVSGVDVIDATLINLVKDIEFVGNVFGHAAAELALQPFDFNIDAVFDQASNTLWFNLNDDMQLDENDLAIVLQGVSSLVAADVKDDTVSFG